MKEGPGWETLRLRGIWLRLRVGPDWRLRGTPLSPSGGCSRIQREGPLSLALQLRFSHVNDRNSQNLPMI